MVREPEVARIVRIFVSSPGDVASERRALDEVVAAVNRTQASEYGIRFELQAWEKDVVPRIGPRPQTVVNDQTLEYNIYLGIMWGRFGTPTGTHGSGTEEEFRKAADKWAAVGTPWILFYFRDDPPVIRTSGDSEQYTRVLKFKEELQSRGIIGTYTEVDRTVDSFAKKVDTHLRLLLPTFRGSGAATTIRTVPSRPDSFPYLQHLLDSTAHIDIRGLATGEATAHRFPIDDLFVTLKAAAPADDPGGRPQRQSRQKPEAPAAQMRGPVALENLLTHRALVVLGDPGSGKSTFLRKTVQGLCRTLLGIDPQAARSLSGLDRPLFPILIRAEDLARYIAERQDERGASKPATRHSAAWLPRFLAKSARDDGWGLGKKFFQDKLKRAGCIVLIDGLDETSDRIARQDTSRVIEQVASMYPACQLIVTSRPAAYAGDVVLSGFTHVAIEPFDEQAIRTFLDRWCEALYRARPAQAATHRAQLEEAVTGPPQIRRLARNPVMLTALAVLHWNEKHLPEQRAELYDSILTWLSRSREKRRGRLSADRCLTVLEQLALRMQTGDARERRRKARLVQVRRRWAAEQIHAEFSARTEAEEVQIAERFLRDEELDSGIIVARGDELRFWHLTFQEFLAARAIARLGEKDQRRLLIGSRPQAYQPEWREVVLLFAGLLAGQGRPKVDGFVKALLDITKKNTTLASQSRCAGLLGSIVRDLAALDYQINDRRYAKLLDAVLGIFDPRRSAGISIDVRIEAAEALGQAGDPRLDPKNPRRWVKIPAGKFWMGAQKEKPDGPNFDVEAFSAEGPVREVHLDTYAIAPYPVTVAEFQTFLDDDGYLNAKWWADGGFGKFDMPEDWDDQVEYPNRPVVGVSWFEAAAYSAWAGSRLPAEAEWEKAARGTEGRKFPWGNEPADPSRLNSDGNVGRPTPVGLYPAGATPSGIYDMAGNVWEWCCDVVNEPVRVVRGGSWNFGSGYARSAYRSGYHPDSRNNGFGFRVVVSGAARSR